MRFFLKHIWMFLLAFFSLSCILYSFPHVVFAAACSSHNVTGWAWSENIGLVSFSCENTTSVGSGIDYGVDISTTTGEFSGYAWAGGGENADGSSTSTIGWIMLNPPPDYVTGLYPSDPQNSVEVDFNSCSGGNCPVSGWARACSGTVNGDCNSTTTSDGWDGWIKMRGTLESSSTQYGVSIATSTPPKEFSEWAWGGDDSTTSAVIGWLSFNCADTDSCATSDYKVLTSIDFPPSATSTKLSIGSPWYCGIGPGKGLVNFQWIYQDTDGDNQSAYWLQVATDSSFSNLVVDATGSQSVVPGGTGSAGVNIVPSPTAATNDFDIGYNDTYYWRIKTKDSAGNWAQQWVDGPASFTTEAHAYPWPSFNFSPIKPSANEVVLFDATSSICYDAGNNATTCASWSWNFDNGATSTSVIATTSYSLAGSYNPSVATADSDGNSCLCTRRINVSLPLPEWKEVTPVSLLREFLVNVIKIFKIRFFGIT